MSKHLGLYWISQYILVSEKMYLFPGYGEKVAQKKNKVFETNLSEVDNR